MEVVLSLVRWWGLEVVVLKGGCAFWVIGDWFGRSCFALALLGGFFIVLIFVSWLDRSCFALCLSVSVKVLLCL